MELTTLDEDVSTLANDWEIIFDSNDSVVFYSPSQKRFLVNKFDPNIVNGRDADEGEHGLVIDTVSCHHQRRSEIYPSVHYFRLLEEATSDFDSYNAGYYERFFEEERRLGTGGYGSVYLARHVLENIDLGYFAVKKIPLSSDNTRSYLSNSLREIRVLQSLHHPNIVQYQHGWVEKHQVADFGPVVPCLFVLMEFCNKGSLAEHFWPNDIRGHSLCEIYLNDMEIVLYMLDICGGLEYLHKRGIVHRDLKPENILMHKESTLTRARLMISDFGTYARAGESDAPAGTLEYMAPELLYHENVAEKITSKQDMWSVGIILYLFIFGRTPWLNDEFDAEEDLQEIKNKILAFDPGQIVFQERNKDLGHLLQSLLDTDPEKRPSAPETYLKLQRIFRDIQEENAGRRAGRDGVGRYVSRLLLLSPNESSAIPFTAPRTNSFGVFWRGMVKILLSILSMLQVSGKLQGFDFTISLLVWYLLRMFNGSRSVSRMIIMVGKGLLFVYWLYAMSFQWDIQIAITALALIWLWSLI